MKCRYSRTEIGVGIDASIPVECPDCGSIRTIPSKSVWADSFIFPDHNEINDYRRLRYPYYHRIDGGQWFIVLASGRMVNHQEFIELQKVEEKQ